MKISVIDTEAGLNTWESAWKQAYLDSGTDNMFLSWEWTVLWWKHYGAGHALRILVAEDEAGVAGIAPLMVTRGGPGTRWRGLVHFPGDEKLADYSDLLTVRDEQTVAEAVLEALRSWADWGAFELRRVPDTSRAGAALRTQLRGQGRLGAVSLECVSPYLTVGGTWGDFFASRSKALRQELRTSGNHLSRVGTWGFDVCRGGELPAAREALYAFHLARQNRRPGTSIFADEPGQAFTRDLTELSPTGWGAEVSVVRVGTRPVSAVLALRGRRTFYYWVPAFDANVTSASLGKLHLKLLIERAFAEGCAVVDLMIGNDRYKRDWANGVQPNWNIAFYADGPTAALARGMKNLRSVLRTVKDRSRVVERLWTWLSKLPR